MVELETESDDEDIIDVVKQTIEKGEFENNDNQNEGSKSQSLSVWSKDFSAGDIILMAHLKEAVENTAEFESSEHLNGRKQISSLLLVWTRLLCYRHISQGWLGRSCWEESRVWK